MARGTILVKNCVPSRPRAKVFLIIQPKLGQWKRSFFFVHQKKKGSGFAKKYITNLPGFTEETISSTCCCNQSDCRLAPWEKISSNKFLGRETQAVLTMCIYSCPRNTLNNNKCLSWGLRIRAKHSFRPYLTVFISKVSFMLSHDYMLSGHVTTSG